MREVGLHHAVQRLIVEDRRNLQAGLSDEIALIVFAIFSGVLWPNASNPAMCPMPCPSWASSWLRMVPSVPRRPIRYIQDSCIAFSSMVILLRRSSARCIGVGDVDASVFLSCRCAMLFTFEYGFPQFCCFIEENLACFCHLFLARFSVVMCFKI